MENNNCGYYNIDGTFSFNLEKFGNSQSNYLELVKIAIPNKQIIGCDPYDPYNPYDKCLLDNINHK